PAEQSLPERLLPCSVCHEKATRRADADGLALGLCGECFAVLAGGEVSAPAIKQRADRSPSPPSTVEPVWCQRCWPQQVPATRQKVRSNGGRLSYCETCWHDTRREVAVIHREVAKRAPAKGPVIEQSAHIKQHPEQPEIRTKTTAETTAPETTAE